MSFRYRMPDVTDANTRALAEPRFVDADNRLWVYLFPGEARLGERVAGSAVSLDTNTSITTAAGTWYDVRIICDGSDVEVWRGESGGAMEKILETSSASTSYSTSHLRFQVAPNYEIHFDDVQVLSESLSSSYTLAYNSANELTSMAGPNGTTNYTHDAWGRQTEKARGSHTATLEYRYGHKLYEYLSDFPGEGEVTYQTGGDGKRRSRVTLQESSWFNWDGSFGILNDEHGSDGSGALARFYIGRNFIQLDGSNPSTGDERHFLTDHINSTRALYDENKVQIAQFEYTPFGSLLVSSNKLATNRRFTGHHHDEDSNLYFAPYRYYNPTTTRWLMRDPMHMIDGSNVYAYVRNAPVTGFDPLGLDLWDWIWTGKWDPSEEESDAAYSTLSEFPIRFFCRISWKYFSGAVSWDPANDCWSVTPEAQSPPSRVPSITCGVSGYTWGAEDHPRGFPHSNVSVSWAHPIGPLGGPSVRVRGDRNVGIGFSFGGRQGPPRVRMGPGSYGLNDCECE